MVGNELSKTTHSFHDENAYEKNGKKLIKGNTVEQEKEKNSALDLLDALTQSGALCLEDVSLHVLIGVTHCFDKTLVDTILQVCARSCACSCIHMCTYFILTA